MLGSWRRPRGYSSNIHIPVESELTASSQVFNANHVFGYIRRSMASSWREALTPFAQRWGAHTQTTVLVWVLGSCRDTEEGSVHGAKMNGSWDIQLWGEAKGDELGQVNKDPLTMWMDSDNDDRVIHCRDVRPYPKEPQPQIAGEVQTGHHSLRKMVEVWIRCLGRWWHNHPRGCPKLGWAESSLIWPSAGNSPLSKKVDEINSRGPFQQKCLWFYASYWAAALFLSKL